MEKFGTFPANFPILLPRYALAVAQFADLGASGWRLRAIDEANGGAFLAVFSPSGDRVQQLLVCHGEGHPPTEEYFTRTFNAKGIQTVKERLFQFFAPSCRDPQDGRVNRRRLKDDDHDEDNNNCSTAYEKEFFIYGIANGISQATGVGDRYSAEARLAFELTRHYSQLATAIPVFGRLRELSRLVAIVRVLKALQAQNQATIRRLSWFNGNTHIAWKDAKEEAEAKKVGTTIEIDVKAQVKERLVQMFDANKALWMRCDSEQRDNVARQFRRECFPYCTDSRIFSVLNDYYKTSIGILDWLVGSKPFEELVTSETKMRVKDIVGKLLCTARTKEGAFEEAGLGDYSDEVIFMIVFFSFLYFTKSCG
jgi:hypothetical protein